MHLFLRFPEASCPDSFSSIVPFRLSQFLRQLSLFQYRLYDQVMHRFEAPVIAITGANGSGKTALLDAVYYLCYTKSYFTAQQQSLARWGSPGFKLIGQFEQQGLDEIVSARWESGKKELSVNGSPVAKTTDFIGQYAAVMIAPDDGELLLGGSELRRRWIDSILAQTDPAYFEHLLHYNRLLQQRNAWLKAQAFVPTGDRIELESYDSRLQEHGTGIYQKRLALLEVFTPILNETYERLSGGAETIRIGYDSDIHQKPMAQWLTDRLQDDLRMQRTTRGIHRDDWDFFLQDQPVRPFASQGQRKTFLFALKLAQYRYLQDCFGFAPTLLLDDVFEKLDQNRMEALLGMIQEPGFGQVLLTDTHTDRVRAAFGPGTTLQMIQT
ncbi:MAG: DNA replication/repair protein RecF [Sphingobacteriales bacterium]|nr:MAG: DNA replication/repair protein RecF [Sphingobacteriales bacterium]